jgi:hypothetical protein
MLVRFEKQALAAGKAGAGFCSVEGEVFYSASFLEQMDCVVNLQVWINERRFVYQENGQSGSISWGLTLVSFTV